MFPGERMLNSAVQDDTPEEVEHSLIKDSVLELTNKDFKFGNEIEEVTLGNIRRNVAEELTVAYEGKPVSRKRLVERAWKPSQNSGVDSDDGHNSTSESENLSKTDFEENEDEPDSHSDLVSNESEIELDNAEVESDELHSSESEVEDDENCDSSDKKKENQEGISLYSSTAKDIQSDIEKGKALINQLSIWEQLLESRIKLQRALISSNKLYQKDNFVNFKEKLNNEDKNEIRIVFNRLEELFENLQKFQEKLLNCCPEYQGFKCNDSKEETSITDSIKNEEEGHEPKQKKFKLVDYEVTLKNQWSNFKPYRDSVIQKWNDKTRVLSGKMNNSDFSAFEHSTLKQIEQILSDKSRLLHRTQTKKSQYSILGKRKNSNSENSSETEIDIECDPEIFDDDDFYHKLLRDLIDRKSSDLTDPNQLGRRWIEIQKLRSKMKRKIDVRATKGRKLRFTVHNKLVNFMAPIPYNTWRDEAEIELYNSLFGKMSKV